MAATFLFAFMALFSAHQASAEISSDSGIEGPPYGEITLSMEKLATDFSSYAEMRSYGKSAMGKDLNLIRIAAPKKSRPMAPAVLITGSTHGNEYLNIADRLPQWILDNRRGKGSVAKFLELGGVIYVVPILNPDGYDKDERPNANGADLNRDFDLIPKDYYRFRQPETKELADFLATDLEDSGTQLRLAMDYHCCIGALLYPWSYSKTRKIPRDDLRDHQTIAQEMVRLFGSGYTYGTTYEVLGYAPWGTSKDYYYAKYGAISYTFEGKKRVEDKKFPQHIQMWEFIFDYLAKK